MIDRTNRMKVIDLKWDGDHDTFDAGFWVALECGHVFWRPTNILCYDGIKKSLKENGAICREGCKPKNEIPRTLQKENLNTMKELIIKIQNLKKQKEEQEIQLKKTKYELAKAIEEIEPRFEEMREKYCKVLTELRKENTDKCIYFSQNYCYAGYRLIQKLELFERYYEITAKNFLPRYEDGDDFATEKTKIPFDPAEDDSFTNVLMEQERTKFLKSLQTEKEKNDKKELEIYLKLKNKFEKNKNEIF